MDVLLPDEMKTSMKIAKTLFGILTVAAALCVGAEIQAQTNEPQAQADVQAKAEIGDAPSQFEQGRRFYLGDSGASKNLTEAAKWFKKAAEQNLAQAQFILGYCYSSGQGVTNSDVEAAKWYQKAADQNYVPAQYNLAICCEAGRGVPTNETEAVKWYSKAAGQNYIQAECSLGNCCEAGLGLPQDEAEAIKWYRRAAEQNYAQAQFNLGVCLTKNAKTFSEGFKWFMVAAAQGYPEAKKKVDEDGPNLTADTYDAARDAAKQFTPKTSISSDESAALKVEAQAFVKKAEDYAVQLAIEAKARAERLAKEEQERKEAQARADAQAKIDAQMHQATLAQQEALDKKDGGSGSSSSSSRISESDVVGRWVGKYEGLTSMDITLMSGGSFISSAGDFAGGRHSHGTWHISNRNTVVIDFGDGGENLLFTYKNDELVAINGRTLRRK